MDRPPQTPPARSVDSARSDSVQSRQSSGWDFRNAPKNYIWLIIFQVGSSAFAFGAVWLITRRLGSEGYGGIFAVIAASQIVQIFTNWTTVAVVRFGVDEFVESAVIARTFWSRFAILAVNLLLLAAIASLWFPPLADWLRLSPATFWLVLVHFVITALWLHVQMGLQAAKRLREQGLLQMIERLLILAGVAALFSAQTLDLRSAVICYIAAPAVMTVAGVVQLRLVIFTRFSLDGQFFKKIFVYSLPLLPYWMVGYLSGNYVDAAFVSRFLSTADLGVYSIAAQVNGIAMQIPTLANTILFPLLLTQQAESASERSFFFFRHILPGAVLIWGVACALLAFAGNLLVPTVFGAEFSGATLPMWILLAGSVFWVPVAVGYAALANATSNTYMSLVASVFSAVINIAANIYLIPRYGIAGCAWATLLAYSASVTIFAVLLNRKSRMPYSWTFLAFVPSVVGAVIISYFELPIWALAGCVASSLVIAIYRKHSLNEMYLFVSGFRRAD